MEFFLYGRERELDFDQSHLITRHATTLFIQSQFQIGVKNRLIFFVAERETSKVSFRIPKLQRTSVKEICFLATGANVETIKWQKVLKTKPSTMTTS